MSSLANEGTLLVISYGVNSILTLYSSRGLTQTLEPIEEAADLHRNINGGLVDLSLTQFRKYRTKISCKDQWPLGIDGLWPGMAITVDCVKTLSYLTSGGSAARTVVPGTTPVVSGSFTFYRPRLSMILTKCPSSFDEWEAAEAWEIEAEEV